MKGADRCELIKLKLMSMCIQVIFASFSYIIDSSENGEKMGAHANQLLIIQVIKTKQEMVHFHAHFTFWRVVCKVSKVNGNLLDTDTLHFFLSHAQQTFEDLYDEPFPI